MKKRRVIMWVVVLLIAVMLVGCGKKKEKEQDKKDPVNQENQVQSTLPEEKEEKPDPEPEPEPEPEEEPAYLIDPMLEPTPYSGDTSELDTVEATARVNVRVNSSLDAAVYKVVDSGTKLQLIQNEGEWSAVYYEGYKLYISSQYLKASGGTAAAGSDAKAYTGDTSKLEKWVTTAGVNVRTSPSTDASIYTTLSTGTVVDYISSEDGWCTIHYQGKQLYIHKDYLQKQSIEPGSETGSSDAEDQKEEEPKKEETAKKEEESKPTKVADKSPGKNVIVIDPGHQSRANTEKEANGPGSSTMKDKVSSGTQGTTTGQAEYKLNLQVALKLRDELESRGYTVIMTRESNDVDLSNVERAQIANEAGADAFIRIHANGSTDSSKNGVMTICQTKANPYNSEYYEASKDLSQLVLNEVVAATGAKKQYVWETDTMTGINWSEVPSTILEMGYLTNPDEDELMASEVYQYLIAGAVADAVDEYMGR